MTKQAAEEIGGSIEMDTQQGAGTCMTVRLPLAGQPETVQTSPSLALLPGGWPCYPEVCFAGYFSAIVVVGIFNRWHIQKVSTKIRIDGR